MRTLFNFNGVLVTVEEDLVGCFTEVLAKSEIHNRGSLSISFLPDPEPLVTGDSVAEETNTKENPFERE